MTPRSVVIALGGNLGDREATLRAAIQEVSELPGVELIAASGFHETVALTPHGVDQSAPAYLNAVIVVSTVQDPSSLLSRLQKIELSHGRVREERWGNRTLDLDIIDVSGVVMATEGPTLPHPHAHERSFVLVPWLEADPDAVLTGHGRVRELLRALTTGGGAQS